MIQFVYIAGSFLAFFLGLLVISKKKKKSYDYVLSVWLFLISAHITIFYLQETAFELPYKWYMINAAFPLLQGVFLYLYTMLLLQRSRIKSTLALHFLPFLIFAIAIYFYGEQLLNSLIISVIISGIVYIILTLKMLGSLGSFFRRNNHWLKLLTCGLGLVWFVFIVIGVLNHLFDYAPIRHEYIFLSVSVFVFGFGYFGLKEGHILQELRTKGNYHSSPLDNNDFAKIKSLLDDLKQDKQFFLNPDLKISDLALQMNIPTHHLSQYFSASLNTTYYNYINDIRIEEFKLRASKNELAALSIMGLAYDCGFKSKATFNRAFKKHSEQTPSEYINSIK